MKIYGNKFTQEELRECAVDMIKVYKDYPLDELEDMFEFYKLIQIELEKMVFTKRAAVKEDNKK